MSQPVVLGKLQKVKKAVTKPGAAFSYGIALARGLYYRLLFRILRKRVVCGRHFRVRGTLIIRGPGQVIFGDNVQIYGKGDAVTPFTHHRNAVIAIGNDVFLNGTRMGCMVRIDIGSQSIVGDARIADTDYHGIRPESRFDASAVLSAPVTIGTNVWIGAGVFILKGVHIGDGSVIGAGAVVTADVPGNCVAAGNPAVVVKIFRQ